MIDYELLEIPALPSLMPLPSQIHGHGMFAMRPFKAGEMLIITGDYVTDESLYAFCFDIEGKAFYPDSPFRYMNHTDNDPHARVEHDDFGDVWLIMNRDCPVNTEILIDYGFDPATEVDVK